MLSLLTMVWRLCYVFVIPPPPPFFTLLLFFCYRDLHKEMRVLFWWLCRWSVLAFHCFFLKHISLASRHLGCLVKLCTPCLVQPSSHCHTAQCSPNVNLVILSLFLMAHTRSSTIHLIVLYFLTCAYSAWNGACVIFWPVFHCYVNSFSTFSVLLSSLYIWPCLSSNDSHHLEFCLLHCLWGFSFGVVGDLAPVPRTVGNHIHRHCDATYYNVQCIYVYFYAHYRE